MSRGVIYILTNPSFPQFVKLGYAGDLHQRLRQLNRSETLPYAFRAYAVYETDYRLTDKALHELIDRLNPDLRTIETFNGKRRVKEFFEMSPEDAYSILDAIARISGTENRLHRVTPNSRGRAALRSDSPCWGSSPATWWRSRRTRTCGPSWSTTRTSNTRGITSSLSALAEQLTGAGHALQGPLYFAYEGELLTERRDRMEADDPARREQL